MISISKAKDGEFDLPNKRKAVLFAVGGNEKNLYMIYRIPCRKSKNYQVWGQPRSFKRYCKSICEYYDSYDLAVDALISYLDSHLNYINKNLDIE